MQPVALVLLPAMPYDRVTGQVAIDRLEPAAPHEYFDKENRAEASQLLLAARERQGSPLGGANVVEAEREYSIACRMVVSMYACK